MVQTRTLEKYLGRVEEIAGRTGVDPESVEMTLKDVKKDIESHRRQPPPPPPAGSISQSEGARKYKLDQATISRWVRREIIHALLRTKKEVYIDESQLAKVAAAYHKKPGRGRRTVQKKFKPQVAAQ